MMKFQCENKQPRGKNERTFFFSNERKMFLYGRLKCNGNQTNRKRNIMHYKMHNVVEVDCCCWCCCHRVNEPKERKSIKTKVNVHILSRWLTSNENIATKIVYVTFGLVWSFGLLCSLSLRCSAFGNYATTLQVFFLCCILDASSERVCMCFLQVSIISRKIQFHSLTAFGCVLAFSSFYLCFHSVVRTFHSMDHVYLKRNLWVQSSILFDLHS